MKSNYTEIKLNQQAGLSWFSSSDLSPTDLAKCWRLFSCALSLDLVTGPLHKLASSFGSSLLKSGSSLLKSGSSLLKSGSSLLKSGSSLLKSVSSRLKSGSSRLKSGSSLLKSGSLSSDSLSSPMSLLMAAPVSEDKESVYEIVMESKGGKKKSSSSSSLFYEAPLGYRLTSDFVLLESFTNKSW
ncbi:hypothetical protein F2Q68_00015021 [Brassica cretica]|uniref:Uncharacterized protein n=2 Tax=Brassica cretica TaxID=69181 RepID=A0ABQ7F0K6_BRACR|nr:hypothetical protein F2Q68_00015021 [Brassica cretica]KAF3609501.1 hypothetical protein DY000_02047762 [Brassica cretica]